jgi:hypothetical protein
MSAVKEPELITLGEGLKLLESHLTAEEAKIRLRQAFVQKAFRQEPLFALSYDEAEIDWTTGSVKIPRKRDRFCPSFSRAEFNAYFFNEGPPMLDGIPRTASRREGEMANDEISEEGRQARFKQWEKLGLDAIKEDLASGGYRLVGGPPQVRALAREWVRMKDDEIVAGQLEQNIQANAVALLKAIERATRGYATPVLLEQLRTLEMTTGEAQAAFHYLKSKGLIEANSRIVYSARMSAAGHDAIKEADSKERRSAPAPDEKSSDEPIPDVALTEIRTALDDIKAKLPAITASNAVKSEIHADISQIEVETERPAPRRRFMKLYLESLRDNLAKAAGAGTAAALVALVGGILAKYFGVF